jgi:hypothetical protein
MRALPVALALAALGTSASSAEPSFSQPVQGTVGVCVRWGDDPAHVQEAIVVQPSKNSALNDAVPNHVRSMDWPRPSKDYAGEWVGMNLVFGQSNPPQGVPDCKTLNQARAQH